VVVFDFDGTLVMSNQLKYDAYFALFPADAGHRRTIRDVLSRQYEESRFVILDSIVAATGSTPSRAGDRRDLVARLAGEYGRIVTEGAKTCPERPGAGALLRELAATVPLYLASTTPETALREILEHRGWLGFFRAVHGYPTRKTDALRRTFADERIIPSDALLVGDGDSDRRAADEAGCVFLPVDAHTDIAEIRRAIHPVT
jgi:phosphoglycolate phosphatase-like HAD superfamily hydrolase